MLENDTCLILIALGKKKKIYCILTGRPLVDKSFRTTGVLELEICTQL
jgi:hypothetical protein